MLHYRFRVTHPCVAIIIVMAIMTCAMSFMTSCRRVGDRDSSGTADRESSSSTNQVTFAKDVAPILMQHCAPCHRSGEPAPFKLLTYDEVRKRAGQIADVTASGFMPPWLPTQGAEVFEGARRLTTDQIATLRHWADQGAPLGQPTSWVVPEPPDPAWQLGVPDLIVQSPEFTLSAEGRDEFRNFVLPVDIDAPRWVSAVELRPGNPRVMHHARLGLDTTGEAARRDAEDPEPGYAGMAWGHDPGGQLVTWQPGMLAREGIAGTAWRLSPHASLVLHMHMQRSGKPETVSFQVGLHFADEPPHLQPVVLRIGSRELDIPANASNYLARDAYTLPVDVKLHSVAPHAHSLCQKVKLTARLPNGERRTLLSIEEFDENWHDAYRFKEPPILPKGTQLITEFLYDNSSNNMRNPHHPPQRVVYGSQAEDEMGDVYLQITLVRDDQRAVLLEDYQHYEWRSRIAGYRHTLKQYADDPWSYEGLAVAYRALHQPAAAIEALLRRMTIPPESVHTLVSLGMAYLDAGDVDKAFELQQRALKIDPLDGLAWLGLGQAQEAQEDFISALDSYRRAVELAKGNAEAQLKLANVMIRNGQLHEARKTVDTVIELSPHEPAAYLKRAEINALEDLQSECLHDLELARQHAPYLHPPPVLLAVFCMQNQQPDRALQILVQANQEMPGHPVIELFLGQFAMRREQWDRARELLDQAASRILPDNWPANHRDRFLILLHRERFHLAQQSEDPEQARAALAAWLRLEPDNVELQQLYERW